MVIRARWRFVRGWPAAGCGLTSNRSQSSAHPHSRSLDRCGGGRPFSSTVRFPTRDAPCHSIHTPPFCFLLPPRHPFFHDVPPHTHLDATAPSPPVKATASSIRPSLPPATLVPSPLLHAPAAHAATSPPLHPSAHISPAAFSETIDGTPVTHIHSLDSSLSLTPSQPRHRVLSHSSRPGK